MNHRLVVKGRPINSMKLKVKPLSDQRMVLTGATSGIGLVTARMAAEKGVKLILNARNEEELKQLAKELGAKGSQVVYVAGDVSKEDVVDSLVEKARDAFGGFDTWVNNASVALYGHAEDIPIEEARRLFDINFWGAVYGMRKAVAHYKDRNEPGVVINIGSVAGNRAFPIQSFYSASKFALHGLTDGIRMELEKSGAPVVISQIHPARVDTPYTDHATSYIDRHPTHKGMVYPPESVAEAILLVAENPKRDIYVGTQSKYFSVMGRVFPRLIDRYMEWDTYSTNFDKKRAAKSPEEGNMYHSRSALMERGNNLGWHRPKSLMVKVKKKSGLTTAILAGSALGLYELMKKI